MPRRSAVAFACGLLVAAAWFPAVRGAGGSPPPPTTDEKAVFERLNARRRAAGRPVLAWDAVSFEVLREYGASIEWDAKLECEEVKRRADARRGFAPGWSCVLRTRMEAEAAAADLLEDPDLLDREFTHGSVGIVSPGNRGTFVGIYLCQIAPLVGRRNVNGPAGDYRFRCPACGHQVVYSLASPHETQMECPKCKTTLSPWIEDMHRALHWPTWYVTPYAPFATGNPFVAWQWVNERVRYDHNKYNHELPGWQTAEETNRMASGVCRDTAVFLAAWLRHSGKDARVVTGLLDGGHHAWVVLSDGETRYLLETALDGSMSRRYPPRLELATGYLPTKMMFDDQRVWLNRGQTQTRDYDSAKVWLALEEAP